MSKETLLQGMMLLGFLVGLFGVARHLMYQFNIMGMRASPSFTKVQICLYVLFALIFVGVVFAKRQL